MSTTAFSRFLFVLILLCSITTVPSIAAPAPSDNGSPSPSNGAAPAHDSVTGANEVKDMPVEVTIMTYRALDDALLKIVRDVNKHYKPKLESSSTGQDANETPCILVTDDARTILSPVSQYNYIEVLRMAYYIFASYTTESPLRLTHPEKMVEFLSDSNSSILPTADMLVHRYIYGTSYKTYIHNNKLTQQDINMLEKSTDNVSKYNSTVSASNAPNASPLTSLSGQESSPAPSTGISAILSPASATFSLLSSIFASFNGNVSLKYGGINPDVRALLSHVPTLAESCGVNEHYLTITSVPTEWDLHSRLDRSLVWLVLARDNARRVAEPQPACPSGSDAGTATDNSNGSGEPSGDAKKNPPCKPEPTTNDKAVPIVDVKSSTGNGPVTSVKVFSGSQAQKNGSKDQKKLTDANSAFNKLIAYLKSTSPTLFDPGDTQSPAQDGGSSQQAAPTVETKIVMGPNPTTTVTTDVQPGRPSPSATPGQDSGDQNAAKTPPATAPTPNAQQNGSPNPSPAQPPAQSKRTMYERLRQTEYFLNLMAQGEIQAVLEIKVIQAGGTVEGRGSTTFTPTIWKFGAGCVLRYTLYDTDGTVLRSGTVGVFNGFRKVIPGTGDLEKQ